MVDNSITVSLHTVMYPESGIIYNFSLNFMRCYTKYTLIFTVCLESFVGFEYLIPSGNSLSHSMYFVNHQFGKKNLVPT